MHPGSVWGPSGVWARVCAHPGTVLGSAHAQGLSGVCAGVLARPGQLLAPSTLPCPQEGRAPNTCSTHTLNSRRVSSSIRGWGSKAHRGDGAQPQAKRESDAHPTASHTVMQSGRRVIAAAGIRREPSEGKVYSSVPWPLRGHGAASLGGTWFHQFSKLTRQAPGCQKQTPSDPPAVSSEPARPVHGKLHRSHRTSRQSLLKERHESLASAAAVLRPTVAGGVAPHSCGRTESPTSDARVSL